jgi:hypothetical protein
MLVLLSGSWPAGEAAASGRTLKVGAGQKYQRISDVADLVRPGDTVVIDPGIYREFVRWRGGDLNGPPITIRGSEDGRPIIDGSGINLHGSGQVPRALFQVEGDNYVIENLEFRNGSNGQNGGGIRVVYSKKTVIRNVRVTRCDMGIMSSKAGDLLIERSEIAYNGTPLFNGYAHNLYLDADRVRVHYCYIHDSTSGENVKSRGRYNELLYNYIADAHDGFEDGQPTKEIGFPQGERTTEPNSHAVLIGNVIVKKGNGHGFIEFGPEGKRAARNGILFMVNNTVIREGGDRKWIFHLSHEDERAVLFNNIFYGFDELSRGHGAANVTGSNNWIPEGSQVPAGLKNSVTGEQPGFVDFAGRDYRLQPDSLGIDAAASGVKVMDPNGMPTTVLVDREYVPHLRETARPRAGPLDIGAIEMLSEEAIRRPSFEISGRLQTGNGRPLPRYSVVLEGVPHKSTITDGEGHYRFRGVLPGRDYRVIPWTDGLTFSPESHSIEQLAANQTVDFGTGAQHQISGTVHGTGGHPLPGIAVIATGPRSGWSYADSQGRYTIDGLPAGGDYTVKAHRSIYQFDPREVRVENLSGVATADFVGTGRFLVEGNVSDSAGQPLQGVLIRVTGGPEPVEGKTNVRGNFSIRELPEGHSYLVTPSHRGYGFNPESVPLGDLRANKRGLRFVAQKQ